MRHRFRFAALACLFASACSHEPRTADFVAAGPYGAGVHTFTFVDASRATPANGDYAGAPDRTLPTDVYYPADVDPAAGTPIDAPLHRGHYPLILHSHGFMDSRKNEAYLGQHLASHGYIVAMPDYPLSKGGAPGGPTVVDTPEQPLDARFVIDQVLAQSADAQSVIAGAADADHIGVSGLSLGGLTTLLTTFHPRLRDPRVKAALAMAPPSCMLTEPFFHTVDVPLVLIQGDADLIVPIDANTRRSFPLTQAPSELFVLKNGSHTGFAGPTALFGTLMDSYDNLGCQAIGNIDVQSFATLGSAAEGISQDPGVCPQPCQTPTAPAALDAQRQQDLTKAIALGFFDGRLRGSAQGTFFVDYRVATDNPELSAQLK